MVELLLRSCDASGIHTLYDVGQLVRHIDTALAYELSVTDDVDGSLRIHKADNIHIYMGR